MQLLALKLRWLMRMTLAERISAGISIDSSGCWVWQRAIVGGYGAIKLPDRRMAKVHRITFELFKGPIIEGLQIDHLCRNRRCCNPDHLEAVTSRVNTQRSERATKLYCKRGHPLFGPNLLIRKTPFSRHCRTCRRIADRESKRRMREKFKAAGLTVRQALNA